MLTLWECLNPGMMLKGRTSELLARATFMHHDDKGHDVLRHHTVLKGLMFRHLAELVPSCPHHAAGPSILPVLHYLGGVS